MDSFGPLSISRRKDGRIRRARPTEMLALLLLVSLSCTSASESRPDDLPSTTNLEVRPVDQTVEVKLLIHNFVSLYNSGDSAGVLALFDDKPVVSDCNYTESAAVQFVGRADVAGWLAMRISDKDQFTLGEIEIGSDPNIKVAGVVFVRRTSVTLRALGFRDGIVPKLAAKVRLVGQGATRRIDAFALGSIGGDSAGCAPST